MEMAVAEAGAVVGGFSAVAVMSAAVGGLGAAVATTQPAHNSAAIRARHPPLGRNMPGL
jgi:hypothetical protein